jgi:hypothetical protein
MREAGWAVIEARAWQDPERALTEAIAKLASARKWQLGEATNLRGALEALARRADDKLVLVLDQVEEFVILAGSERQQAFIALINDLRTKPVKGLKLQLVLRSDYKSALDELGLPLPRQGENWQEVGRLTIAAGMKFMARSGQSPSTSSVMSCRRSVPARARSTRDNSCATISNNPSSSRRFVKWSREC